MKKAFKDNYVKLLQRLPGDQCVQSGEFMSGGVLFKD
jgi:hypothetical protein